MKDEKKLKYGNKALMKLPFLLLIPLGLWLPRLAERYSDTVETVYSAQIFPPVANALGLISSLAPSVSLAECIIGLLALTLAVLLIVGLVRLIARRAILLRFMNHVLALGVFAGCMLVLFYALWGFNYTRAPLSERMGLDVRERPVAELEELSARLADEAASCRAEVSEDSEGVFIFDGDFKECFALVAECYVGLGQELHTEYDAVFPAKPVHLSTAMSYGGISGIFIPFTCECNVNVDQPWLLIPAAAAHENAHSAGIAPENEAEFAGVLACLESESAAVRYSGLMSALLRCTNSLYSADPDAYFRVRERYSDGMVRDLVDYNLYWASFEGPVEEVMDDVNDGYLRHNRQESGIKSYGEMVDLLLAYYYSDAD